MKKQRQPVPWEVVDSRPIYSAPPWIELSVQSVRLPNGRVISDYHQIRLPEYSVVFAETPDSNVIVLRQYRHGMGGVTISLPAGFLETGESPLQAAQRELYEETGYKASGWHSLGSYVLNSNYGCGKAHLFKATNAHSIAAPESGDLEEAEMLLMERAELLRLVGEMPIMPISIVTTIALATNPHFKALQLNSPSECLSSVR